MKKSLGLLVLTCLLGNVGWSAADEDRWVASQMARVVISPDGRIAEASLQDSSLGLDMQAEIERRIRQFEFEPAMKNGIAVATETNVWVQLSLVPEGETLALKVTDAGVCPGMLRLTPPRFPASQLSRSQGAEVQLAVDYDDQGKVTKVEVVSAEPDLRVFREASLKAAREWLFSPERVDGQPMAGSALIPVRFAIEGDDAAKVRFPDGGSLQVTRARQSEQQLLGSSAKLRSIGEEVAETSQESAVVKPAS